MMDNPVGPPALSARRETAATAAEALRLLTADSRSPETRRAYEGDLRDFFRWRGHDAPSAAAVAELCGVDAGALALALNGYKAHLIERGLAESTVNRRLAALRSLLRMARRLGAPIPDPSGLVTGERVTAYRDTRGPALADVRRLLAAPDRSTLAGKRDFALLLLMAENALRRGELARCDAADFDPAENRLMILGKGRGTQREPITLSDMAVSAIADYLAFRGDLSADAPLFCNVARFSRGGDRITGRGLLHVVDRYGRRVLGRPIHPHALRHTAITAVLDAGADIRDAQRFSRHRDIRTLQLYDDNRQDKQGRLTVMLSALLHLEQDEGSPGSADAGLAKTSRRTT